MIIYVWFLFYLPALSYQPPSWYKIAGSLAVGLVGDRICPANPLTMKPSIAASLRSSFTSLTRRRHRSRSSSLVAARRERSTLKQSPSASVPLLSLGECALVMNNISVVIADFIYLAHFIKKNDLYDLDREMYGF